MDINAESRETAKYIYRTLNQTHAKKTAKLSKKSNVNLKCIEPKNLSTPFTLISFQNKFNQSI